MHRTIGSAEDCNQATLPVPEPKLTNTARPAARRHWVPGDSVMPGGARLPTWIEKPSGALNTPNSITRDKVGLYVAFRHCYRRSPRRCLAGHASPSRRGSCWCICIHGQTPFFGERLTRSEQLAVHGMVRTQPLNFKRSGVQVPTSCGTCA